MRSLAPALARLAGICLSALLFGVLALPSEASASGHSSRIRGETFACFGREGRFAKNAPGYVGLSISKAETRARNYHKAYRVIARDGQCFNIVSDGSNGRVNLWIVRGKVVKAEIF
jgi:hypothetical protein